MGPMDGLRVVEVAHEFGAFAGKLLADAGADVVVVEPPGGAAQRTYGPFADDEPEPERSLAWWADNTSKRSVVLDLDARSDRETLARLVAWADVLIECEPDRLDGIPFGHRRLVHTTITPFGRHRPRSREPVTDLTILAEGGPVWSCGYDDHSLPPVRGGGDQGYRIACHFAVMSILTALLYREQTGRGQHIDVSMNAAANVTTEFASYSWMAARETVQRQTGRHASYRPTDLTQVQCQDGRWLNTGVPPRTPREFEVLHAWLVDLDLVGEFPLAALLEMGSQYEHISLQMILEDPLVAEVFGAGREAIELIASRLPAYETFIGLQERGLAAGIIYSPEEMMTDPHFVARGFPTEVHQEEIGRSVLHPGAPIRFTATPMGIRGPAPALGAHTDEVLSGLDA